MSDEAAYFNRVQLCRHLNISDRSHTLEEWIEKDGFPKPGRKGRWSRKKVDRWMAGDDEADEAVASENRHDEIIQEIKNAAAALDATHH